MIEQAARSGQAKRIRGQSLRESDRIARAAWAFTTRRVPRDASHRISHDRRAPQAGDLVLARVDVLGHHRGLQLPCGRKQNLFPGDEIVAVYGNRYAPAQFEAIVPKTMGPCQLVAGGGVAAKALSWHSRISRGPTLITPIGLLLGPDGEPINLRDHAVEALEPSAGARPATLAVVGTAMDAGKTDSAAHLVKGLTRAGLQVGFAKVTGTGAGGDTWLLKDAGADPVLDFTDAGLVSTYRVEMDEIEGALTTLMAHLMKAGVDVVVLEIADGVMQQETAALIESSAFESMVDAVLFASRDSMGAESGVRWLKQRDVAVAGVTGVLTAAPLQIGEATAATGLPVFTREELSQASYARRILRGLRESPTINGAADVRSGAAGEQGDDAVAAEASHASRYSGGSGPGIPGLRAEHGRA